MTTARSKNRLRRGVAVLAGVGALTAASLAWHGQATAKLPKPIPLPVTPETTVWGYFPIDAPPALTVTSGDVVRSDCVSASGTLNPAQSPVEFFAGFGIPADQVLPELTDIWANEPKPPQSGPHILTGPIYVEGAEPGDTLEVRILDFDLLVPYGINSFTARGVISDRFPAGPARMFFVDPTEHVMRFKDDIEVPLKPFMGVMGVAPASDFVSPLPPAAAAGIVSSVPPGPFGGNMDHNDLSIGTSLFLPVFQPGAQFYSGDCHAVQGNGEVDGTALEHSRAGIFQFILHKGGNLAGPRAETPTHYVTMGIDVDLQRAMELAVLDAVDFLMTEKGFSKQEAYSFCSLAVDFNVAENVDFTQLVQGRIPKRFFDDYGKKPRFWHHTPVRDRSELQRTGHAAF